MKRTIISGISTLAVATALFCGCDADTGKKGAASAAPSASPSASAKKGEKAVASSDVKTASEACANYVKELEACIAKQEGEAKKPWQDELDAHKKAFAAAGDAAKTQLEKGCVTGVLSLKQNCK